MRVAQLAFTSLLCVCYVLGAMAGLCIVVGDGLLSMVRVCLGIKRYIYAVLRVSSAFIITQRQKSARAICPAELHHRNLSQHALQGRQLLRQRAKLFVQSRQALLPPVQHTSDASGLAAALVPILVLGDSG